MSMMDPGDPTPPQDPNGPEKPKGPSTARITIWIVVGGIGLYLVVSGLWGVFTK